MNVGALLVDDEEDIRLLLRMLIELENRGLFVSGEASDGTEALERIDELDPAVVVLDERMPGMSGIETLRLLRERRPNQHVIVCSAHLDADLRRRAEEAGASACVGKNEIARIPSVLRSLMAS